MATFKGQEPLLAGVLAAIGASVCCVGPLVLLTLGIGGAWIANLTALEPLRPWFIAATLLFLGLAFRRLYLQPGLRARRRLRRTDRPSAAAADLLACRAGAARVVVGALVGAILSLKGPTHAPFDCRTLVALMPFGRAGCAAADRRARRAEHDLRAVPGHGEEIAGEGGRCEPGSRSTSRRRRPPSRLTPTRPTQRHWRRPRRTRASPRR